MRILVVEDDKQIANLLERGLREESYAVDLAYDGEEGYQFATSKDYDLIILDILLPKLDGITLCSRLRSQRFTLPIMMLTARDGIEDKVKGLDSGADDYLTKPFVFDELLARIRAYLRKKVKEPLTFYQVGDLTLDLLTHKVKRNQKEIALTAKEYNLLQYLMFYAGTVVSRAMICKDVWDMDLDVSSNVVDVYINYLRTKIDSGEKDKLIQTIRGLGYMIKAPSQH